MSYLERDMYIEQYMENDEVEQRDLLQWIDKTYDGGKLWARFSDEVLRPAFQEKSQVNVHKLDEKQFIIFRDFCRSQEMDWYRFEQYRVLCFDNLGPDDVEPEEE